MGPTRVETFILSGFSGRPTRGTVTIREVTREERWRRAVRGVGTWWGLGLVSVLIPVAHFVLVPACVLYGAWQGVQRLGNSELASGARGTCPDCGQEQEFEVAARWRAPQAVTCRSCGRGLRLSLPTD